MYSLYITLLLITFSKSATVVPLQSSHIDVRQSGAEFSYNIQENHGIAAIGEHIIPVASPLIKTIQIEEPLLTDKQTKDKHEELNQPIIAQQAEARAFLDLKELKNPEAILTQPLLLSPLENYAYYYPHTTYSLPTLPKSSYISYISASPGISGIPYPYTLIRTV